MTKNDVESDDERVALANLMANLKLDVDGNKKIQKQSKKANTTLAQELKECKTILAKTIDYDKLKRKLNETLGLLAQKDIYIKEGLKLKAYEISAVKEKDDELVKQCLLTKSHYEGLVKVKTKVNHTKDHFRAPTIQDMDILIKTCLMPLALKTHNDSFIFVHELKQEMHADLKRFIKTVNAHTLPQTARQAVSNTNVLKPGMYRIDTRTTQTRAPQLPRTFRNINPRVSTSTGVNHKTNVSRPQHRSNQMKDNVMPNNSQVKLKKTQVEDHPRISSIYNKTKSVTACNDSLNSRTSNVNTICATCGKCLVDSDHFACVTKMLNDVNARTKKPNIIQLILFIVDFGCTKHMTVMEIWFKEMSRLTGFITSKDSITISSRSDLYTISLQELTSTSLCLMAKASPTQAWLWHRRLSHLNFNYINLLSKKDIVIGLLKLKYVKDQLCSSCEVSKAKRSSFKTKTVPSSKGRLNLLHIDLCGPMRDASINGKKYILVIVDDYSRYTWTLFLQMSEMSVANESSGLVPQRQKALDYDNSDPVHQLQNVSSSADAHFLSQQELDLLFGPLYDEFFTACTSSVNKSFSPTNTSTQQYTLPTTNIHPTSALSTLIIVHAEENNDNQAEEGHLFKDEFTNPFCTPGYHQLEKVCGNPSKPVQTRRQLATDPEMCMFALTVRTAKPKNIKEAMADSAWIEAMQEELHQFDRLQVLERAKVYCECMEPFKPLMCLWVRSRSMAAIWLEKVVTPLIEPAIKGFAAAPAVLKPERLKVDKTRYE
uniref:Retrovirus-related Pol polyprotein from transposon TNT 1-94 n=1 Tax=Tanacetum cinerariifolium TaxID=118510 RepID=A0A6L2MN47_TANCI|nr:retrovirus-related Pol polyprotein from transposon TNT 1-94 [Tanacetum cinerariifolium]